MLISNTQIERHLISACDIPIYDSRNYYLTNISPIVSIAIMIAQIIRIGVRYIRIIYCSLILSTNCGVKQRRAATYAH